MLRGVFVWETVTFVQDVQWHRQQPAGRLLPGRLLRFLVSALELGVITDIDVETPEEKSREQDNQGKEETENIAHIATLGRGV